jgi:glycosyltransferase involved in cell wall biosynthesis
VVAGQRERGHEVGLFELWPGPESLPEVQEHLHGLDSLHARKDNFRPDVVHLHSQLPDYAGFGPAAVLTAHDHSSHCPSGGRHLEARGCACSRRFGLAACLWGHYVDRCGSRNPASLRTRFRITYAAPSFPGTWIAPSRYSRDRLVERGMDPARIELLPNPGPVALEDGMEPSPPGDTVLFLGRLVPNKGCGILIRAIANLPGVRLQILGEGPERPRLERLVRDLDLGGRVEFPGWRSSSEVRGYLAGARVLAIPALWPEPFGLVALEAYASGRPVVASGMGGLLDTVRDGTTGILVVPGDPQALSSALGMLLSDRDIAERMGRAGLELVRTGYALGSHLDSLDRIYVRCADADGAGLTADSGAGRGGRRFDG